jgi:hypothetical protein
VPNKLVAAQLIATVAQLQCSHKALRVSRWKATTHTGEDRHLPLLLMVLRMGLTWPDLATLARRDERCAAKTRAACRLGGAGL